MVMKMKSHGFIQRMMPLLVIVLLVAIGVSPAMAAPLTNNRHVFINVANDAGVKYNLDGATFGGPANTYYMKCDGGGLNQLKVTNDPAVPGGQFTTSSAQSGTFWIATTGGRGYNDEVILLISVQDPVPDDFAVHIKSSGETWTPSSSYPSSPVYVTGAVDETFTKADFIYGAQTWKPGPGTLGVPSLPLWFGQDITDASTNSYLMFVDLNAGNKNAGSIDGGAVKVEYSFTNLDTSAAFNAYAWTLASNQGQGISWTNNPFSPTQSGYYVTGIPRTPAPEFPTLALPVAFIIGMLGAVLFIRRTKEN
jgi:large repetitive protein